jgi:hypothetical protein
MADGGKANSIVVTSAASCKHIRGTTRSKKRTESWVSCGEDRRGSEGSGKARRDT